MFVIVEREKSSRAGGERAILRRLSSLCRSIYSLFLPALEGHRHADQLIMHKDQRPCRHTVPIYIAMVNMLVQENL